MTESNDQTTAVQPLLWRASRRLRRRHWLSLDLFFSAAAILAAYALQPQFVFGWGTSNLSQPGAFQAALGYPWFVVVCMHVVGMQDPLGGRRGWSAFLLTALAVAAALGLYLFVLYAVSLENLGRTILSRTFVLSLGLLFGVRAILWKHAASAPARIGCFMRRGPLERFCGLVEKNHLLVRMAPEDFEAQALTPAAIADYFVAQHVDEVVVTSTEVNNDLWLACFNRGVQVTDVTVFVEREYYKVPCNDLDLAWFLRIDLKWNHVFYHRFKRTAELLIVAAALPLVVPVVAAAALATYIESGGPIFYSQIRVGLRGKNYRLWKLRTMRVDAEDKGATWAVTADSRITRVGRVLRRTRIDEIPQFLNVLNGEMSLIGPRPERPEFVTMLEQAIPLYSQRHWVKPGITGWAQINYPYGASIDDAREKLCYDLYYVKNASPLLDAHIALRTIGALMKGSR
jgi:exopolysaccharide biosynthesis polyprenyl glycosylphosphotransferase